MTKMKIRSYSFTYCVKKKRDKKIFKENNLQVAMDSNPSQITQDSYYTSKKKLEQIEKEELNSIVFKSKIKLTEDALENHNYLNKVVSKLEIDGKIMDNPADISKAQSKFDQDLYTEKLNETNQSYKDSLHIFLKNNKSPKLSEEQKNLHDKPITEKEILESIKNLATGKTPESDGLPADYL